MVLSKLLRFLYCHATEITSKTSALTQKKKSWKVRIPITYSSVVTTVLLQLYLSSFSPFFKRAFMRL